MGFKGRLGNALAENRLDEVGKRPVLLAGATACLFEEFGLDPDRYGRLHGQPPALLRASGMYCIRHSFAPSEGVVGQRFHNGLANIIPDVDQQAV